MKVLLKVVLVIIAINIVLGIGESLFTNMKDNSTYVSENNKDIKLQFTDEVEVSTDDLGYITSSNTIIYLYVGNEQYKGRYTMYVSNKFRKEGYIDFYDYYKIDTNNTTKNNGILSGTFKMKRNKLIISSYDELFLKNNTFIKKTWWNTWGKKAVILMAILFFIWVFKDIPKELSDKEYRESLRKELKEEYTDEIVESIKEAKNDLVYGLKSAFKDENGVDSTQNNQDLPIQDVSVTEIKSEVNAQDVGVAAQKTVHMFTCIKCGKLINENARFCKFCGTKIDKMHQI